MTMTATSAIQIEVLTVKTWRARQIAELRVFEEDDEVAVRDERRDAADHERHRQRPDECVDAQPGDDQSVDQADREPDRDAEGYRDGG